MKFKGLIVEKALIKRNVYVLIEGEDEEEALQLLQDDDYEIIDEEDITELGTTEILNKEILGIYD